MPDSPAVLAAKRLLDVAKREGFAFERIAPGEDGPLRGVRDSDDWLDEIYLGGFSWQCHATRKRRWSLIVPGGLPVTESVSGDALTVLHKVSEWTI